MARKSTSRAFNQKAGVYPGTFSPITRGHLDIILQAAKLMDKLYVVVAINPAKDPLFTSAERVDMARAEITDYVLPRLKTAGIKCDIAVVEHSGLTAHFMKEHSAPFYIRGLRMGTEFDAEYPALVAGQREYKDFTPVFLCSSDPYLHIASSNLARELEAFNGTTLNLYVTPRVAEKLKQRITERGMRIEP